MNQQLLLFFLFLFSTTTTNAQQQNACVQTTFSKNRLFASCNTLPYLGATLHWTYHPSNATADVAFRSPQSPDGWVSWALNPTTPRSMINSQALIAFLDQKSSAVAVYTTSIESYTPTIKNESLSFPVYRREAEYRNGVMTIYASIGLPGNRTRVNQVWQKGTEFSGGLPAGHPTSGENAMSMGTVDLLSGEAAEAAGGSKLHRRNVHGVLNAVSWGILMPTGAIIARYLKVFESADPAWFYLHVACQTSAYIVGVAGWGTGLKLGSESAGITYDDHRNMGIALFCFGTLQVFALLLRPNKDHKYRLYWNIYHRGIGFAVVILGVVNIFEGFDILEPDKGWKQAYIAIIAALGGLALILEAVTWTIVLRRRSRSKSHGGANGYGA